MNWKRFFVASAVTYVVVQAMELVINNVLMKSANVKESEALALTVGGILLSFISIVENLLRTAGHDPGGSIVKGDEYEHLRR